MPCLVRERASLRHRTSPPTAEQVHSWLARHLDGRPHPSVKRPINWMLWIATITAVLGAGTAARVAWPFILPIIQNRNVWAAISLIGILLFTSGHMFNQIRKVPYVAGDGRGGITYFANGFQNQFGLETQIVAAICTFAACLDPRHICTSPTNSLWPRWNSLFRHHLPGAQGSESSRSQTAAGVRPGLGRRHGDYVQLPAEHFPHQERRLPLRPPAVLVS